MVLVHRVDPTTCLVPILLAERGYDRLPFLGAPAPAAGTLALWDHPTPDPVAALSLLLPVDRPTFAEDEGVDAEKLT
jgi:hypothetical protein